MSSVAAATSGGATPALSRQATRPVMRACASRQRAFDTFRTEYNDGRPREYLDMATPTSRSAPHSTNTPRAYRRKNIQGTTRKEGDHRKYLPPASITRCTSLTLWSINTSDFRRRTAAFDRSTSTLCSLPRPANETSTSGCIPKCYPCTRTKVLPIIPAVHVSSLIIASSCSAAIVRMRSRTPTANSPVRIACSTSESTPACLEIRLRVRSQLAVSHTIM